MNFSDRDNDFNGKHFVAGNNDRVDIQDIILPKELVNNSMNSFLKDRIEKNVDMSK